VAGVSKDKPKAAPNPLTLVAGSAKRRRLDAQLSEESYAGWVAYAAAQGVTVAALMEVAGVWLGAIAATGRIEGQKAAIEADLVKAARHVAATRRRRSN
jgi:hypothetical protein